MPGGIISPPNFQKKKAIIRGEFQRVGILLSKIKNASFSNNSNPDFLNLTLFYQVINLLKRISGAASAPMHFNAQFALFGANKMQI